jgi:hypothetical protein
MWFYLVNTFILFESLQTRTIAHSQLQFTLCVICYVRMKKQ